MQQKPVLDFSAVRDLRSAGRLILCVQPYVLDVSDFAANHPGGSTVLINACKLDDATSAFRAFHSQDLLEQAYSQYGVGTIRSPAQTASSTTASSSSLQAVPSVTGTPLGSAAPPPVQLSTALFSVDTARKSIPWWPRCTAVELSRLTSINAFHATTNARIPKPLREHWDFGNEDNESVDANLVAWQRYALCPRAVRDVRLVQTSVNILGFRFASPIIAAPFATSGAAHPDAELGIARACASLRLGFVAPHYSSIPLETVSFSLTGLAQKQSVDLICVPYSSIPLEEIVKDYHKVCPVVNPTSPSLFFQFYAPDGGGKLDRVYTEQCFRFAESAGYRAVMVTVDSPVLAIRDRTYGSPEWIESLAMVPPTGGFPKIRGFASVNPTVSQVNCATLSWDDLRWMSTLTSMKLVIKGLMTAADARLAAQPNSGIAGIVVSNHGGRQLDGTLGTAEVLAEIVQAVRSEADRHRVKPIEVFVDGGIRRGKDIVRALALGASAVLVGRPILWGLALGGEAGVSRVLSILNAELLVTMRLCGVTRLEDITPDLVRERSMLLPSSDSFTRSRL